MGTGSLRIAVMVACLTGALGATRVLLAAEEKATEEAIKPGDKVKVKAGPAPLMRGTEKLTDVEDATELTALKVQGKWVQVRVEKGETTYTGWVDAPKHLSRGRSAQEEAKVGGTSGVQAKRGDTAPGKVEPGKAQAQDADWPFVRGTPQGTGVVAHAGPRTTPKVVWRFRSGGPNGAGAMGSMTSIPVASGGLVYWGSDDGKLYALRTATGEKVWERAVGSDPKAGTTASSQILGGAAVLGKNAYVGSFGEGFECLDRGTGKLLWRSNANLGFLIVVGSPVASGKTVIVGSSEGLILHDDSGGGIGVAFRPPPSIGVKGCVFGPVTTDGECAFFGSDNGCVYAFQPPLCRVKWEFRAGEFAFIREAVAVADGHAIFCAANNLCCLNAKSGELVWQKQGAEDNDCHGPAVGKDFVIVTSSKGRVTCFAKKDGALQWKHESSRAGTTAPIVGKDVVYFSTEDTFEALDLANGNSLWTLKLPTVVTSSPSLADGLLFASGADGALYAIGSPQAAEVKP